MQSSFECHHILGREESEPARYRAQMKLEWNEVSTPQHTSQLFLLIMLSFKTLLEMNFGENGVSAEKMLLPALNKTLSVLHKSYAAASNRK